MPLHYDWDTDKNKILIATRGVSLEEVVVLLENGDILDVLDHPNKSKHAHQKIYVVEINSYVYLVPFVEDANKIFLKTIIPNRKAQKKYLGD